VVLLDAQEDARTTRIASVTIIPAILDFLMILLSFTRNILTDICLENCPQKYNFPAYPTILSSLMGLYCSAYRCVSTIMPSLTGLGWLQNQSPPLRLERGPGGEAKNLAGLCCELFVKFTGKVNYFVFLRQMSVGQLDSWTVGQSMTKKMPELKP
jgi:hypothetical protein